MSGYPRTGLHVAPELCPYGIRAPFAACDVINRDLSFSYSHIGYSILGISSVAVSVVLLCIWFPRKSTIVPLLV